MIKLLLMSHMDFMRDFSFHKLGQHLGRSSCPLFSEHPLRVCCFIFISTFGGSACRNSISSNSSKLFAPFSGVGIFRAYATEYFSLIQWEETSSLSHPWTCADKERGSPMPGPYICYPQTCTFVLATRTFTLNKGVCYLHSTLILNEYATYLHSCYWEKCLQDSESGKWVMVQLFKN